MPLLATLLSCLELDRADNEAVSGDIGSFMVPDPPVRHEPPWKHLMFSIWQVSEYCVLQSIQSNVA